MTVQIPAGLVARGPHEATPPRRPGSVRRTSTIDMRWPAGPGTQLLLTGRARDLVTPAEGCPFVLDEDVMRAGLDPRTRTIESLSAEPARQGLDALIGARAGGSMRSALTAALADEAEAGTPLYLLLDDIAGSSLIAGFAYLQWTDHDLLEKSRRTSGPGRDMTGVCTGFQPGSGALRPDGGSMWNQQVRPVDPLPRADDPAGWHEIEDITEIAMRRARRIDVHVDDVIVIDSMFQDSSTTPAGGRVAVHEYHLTATADPRTGELLTIEADPRVLPYNECPLASLNVGKILGTPLSELRTRVREEFPGTEGCTHLNDAMRALAEAPILLRSLA